MSDRQGRLSIGRFTGEAWAVLSQCRTYRYRLVRVTLGVEGFGLHEAEDPQWERLLAGRA